MAKVERISAPELWNRVAAHDIVELFADSGHTYKAAEILFGAYREQCRGIEDVEEMVSWSPSRRSDPCKTFDR